MNHQTQIPWQRKTQWQAALASIAQIRNRYQRAFFHTEDLSCQIKDLYISLSSRMEMGCFKICPSCPDVCCTHATIWYDFKDLLFLSFSGDWRPKRQITRRTTEAGNKICSHLGQEGCMLERFERPFVCTWYMCPQLRSFLCRTDPRLQRKIRAELSKIKALRKEMEEDFIRIPCI